jgi:hypothetical protein
VYSDQSISAIFMMRTGLFTSNELFRYPTIEKLCSFSIPRGSLQCINGRFFNTLIKVVYIMREFWKYINSEKLFYFHFQSWSVTHSTWRPPLILWDSCVKNRKLFYLLQHKERETYTCTKGCKMVNTVFIQ